MSALIDGVPAKANAKETNKPFGDKHPILDCLFGILALPFAIGGFIFALSVLNVFIN